MKERKIMQVNSCDQIHIFFIVMSTSIFFIKNVKKFYPNFQCGASIYLLKRLFAGIMLAVSD